MNNNPVDFQPTRSQRSQQPPILPRQPPPQLVQPYYSSLWDVAQRPQQSHVRAPPALTYNPQWAVPPAPEQSALYTNCDYSFQQFQYQQDQDRVPPPVAQPSPVQPGYIPYHPTAEYIQHYRPHEMVSPQPQLSYYSHLQPQQQQQQKRLRHTLLQHHISSKRQRLDGPNLDSQGQHHGFLSPQSQFQLPLPLDQNIGVYSGLNQGSDHVDGPEGRNNEQFSSNVVGNFGGTSGGARGWSTSGNRGGVEGRGQRGSHMGSNSGNGRGGQSHGGVHAHGMEGTFWGATSMQAGVSDAFPNIFEPATVHVAAQFQDAHDFNIGGNPQFTTIGVNHSVNFYGGTHGLENLKGFVSFAAFYNSCEQDSDRRCHPGTREHVLTRLRHWIGNPNATDRIFWLHGPAGAGKSAIAQTIAHEYYQGEIAATFFFFRSDSARNDGNRLFPTIAWQLAFSIPATKESIVHALDKTPHLPMTDVETQFEQLVAQIFQPTNNIAFRMRHPAPVVIIDGIDECSNEQLQRRFLTVIGNAVKDRCLPLRFLIVSRPEALIEETLNQFQDFNLRIDLATLEDSNRDIEKYLVDKFSAIGSKQSLSPTWPGQEIIEDLVFKSSGNFIFTSAVMRFISDEDYSAESQLDIVRKLKPQGTMSPFALLDELYLEILKRQRDQDFLKTFLALLVGRSSLKYYNIHEDDAMLMNVAEQELHIKLRRMRSLLKFEPFIDLYHKSFLDFLQDSSRSGQYHVSKQGGLKRYLELVVDSIVRHVSIAIEKPICHEACHFSPRFQPIAESFPLKIVLPIEDWQEALKPLLHLQDKLFNTPKLQPCPVTQVMRDLQLYLVLLRANSPHIAVAQMPDPTMNEAVTDQSPADAGQDIPEEDLDRCFSELLACLQKPNLVLAVDMVIIGRMSSLLAFDHAKIVARVRSVTNAQKLIDMIDLLINNESLLEQCGPDAARKAALLASEIFARVPLLPQSVFLNARTHQQRNWLQESKSGVLEFLCQSTLISRILDHNHILPILWISQGDKLKYVDGIVNEQNESIHKWLKRSRPNFVTGVQVMLEAARAIRYIHSMDVVAALGSFVIRSNAFVLDSNLRPKVMFRGSFAWQVREKLIYDPASRYLANYTHQSNISAFADLFYSVCFDDDDKTFSNHLVEDAKQLIERCRVKDSKRRTTMEDIVNEMETWNLS